MLAAGPGHTVYCEHHFELFHTVSADYSFLQVTGMVLEGMSTSAAMPQGKRVLAGMKSRSKSASWRRSMRCTLPHMEKAMREDLQVIHHA